MPIVLKIPLTNQCQGDNTVQTYIISDTEAAFLLGDILLFRAWIEKLLAFIDIGKFLGIANSLLHIASKSWYISDLFFLYSLVFNLARHELSFAQYS